MNAISNDGEVIRSVTLSSLTELLQSRGYRVERATDAAGVELLRSATGGLAFEIRVGSLALAPSDAVLDFSCHAALKVEGTLDAAVPNAWNNSRRYARLHLHGGFLVLTQDVSVAGGVLPGYVLTQMEIWERLLQDLPGFLRTEIAQVNAAGPSAMIASSTREDDVAAA
ncbi:YbjN domain-containing protein [Blastochloris viridis]|uniref:YbjN domain-containing protein n=1 Tax=Blastochloris viridis TaxID=1079 RepID=A0A0H5BH78_BLAVI|nr:YbjN domain-containing protein [Blastochloris viridis]ALK09636.1 hypothetical protein BVIR_1862 [Blastochloris viridis]BAS00475.1 hypothetical protein BV133_2881 [Blastochloris viridis]CUU42299.1 hypothetical protein BVIRIDIS_13070 [Blastochloris viridis]